MIRTLGFFHLCTAMFIMIVLVGICLFNMYLLATHRRGFFIICIHISSFFAIGGLIARMMSMAVFVLPMARVYLKLSRISLTAFGVGLFCGAVAIMICGRKHNYRILPQNMESALSSIEDVVFVIDRDGLVTHINHPEKYHSLFGNIGSVDQLLSFMQASCSACWKYGETLDALQGTAVCELMFNASQTYCIFEISPIIIDGNRLGYTAVLEDVSVIKQGEKILREQNDYLKQANRKLSNYVRVAGALEAEKERLQILEHVQVTLIRDIEKALSTIHQTGERQFENEAYQVVMKNLATQLRQTYREVRNAVGKIAGKEV